VDEDDVHVDVQAGQPGGHRRRAIGTARHRDDRAGAVPDGAGWQHDHDHIGDGHHEIQRCVHQPLSGTQLLELLRPTEPRT
jgi:hypothetical protein